VLGYVDANIVRHTATGAGSRATLLGLAERKGYSPSDDAALAVPGRFALDQESVDAWRRS
jgi:hypothetical protein